MSTNFTLDDSSSDIIYSSNWASQSTSMDTDTQRFFQSTYHSAQSSGATANLTFTGSAVYLYGSVGPAHGNYTVQIDDAVALMSAYAFSTSYQQLLFSYQLGEGQHNLSISAMTTEQMPWLDLDFITITSSNSSASLVAALTASSSSSTASQTLTPPWMTDSALVSGSTSDSSNASSTTSSSSGTSSTSNLSFILAVVFGALIAGALLVAFFVLIHRWRRREASTDDNVPKGGLGAAAGHRSMLSLGLGAVGNTGSVFFSRNKRPSSPSFMAGPKSPSSPAGINQAYYPGQSPTSRTDPFYREPTPLEQPHHFDGRNSPFSNLTLTPGSTTQLLYSEKGKISPSPIQQNAQLHQGDPPPSNSDPAAIPASSASETQSIDLEKPSPLFQQQQKQQPSRDSSVTVAPNFGLFACDSKSMAGSGIGTLVPEYTAFSAPLEQLRETGKSEEGGCSSSLLHDHNVATASSMPSLTLDQLSPLSPNNRPTHTREASYYLYHDPSKYNKAGQRKSQKPPRPKRKSGDGLLEWLGNGISKGIERSSSWKKKRKDDADSQRSDFLKV